ncbi:GNAT family N-acetyltransferase [Prochlorococcus sp. MIT 1307]|uniref:GNAT family N-acetyltransferase n=1 Tax=Prochlorococcus sp. MIT 1307 TaxID=3096219 RepID=UPI002A76259A|nr:GNAT family N-acetyltransferase [Prochlorococcus sp. MIT 1307]
MNKAHPLKSSHLKIRPLQRSDIPLVTQWSRTEGFAPGAGDVSIYRHTDRQGLWIGTLGKNSIGCIAGVRYNASYGFIGLFLVVPHQRGNGFGLELWKHALSHLNDLPCIGLEAALDRIKDYESWGFKPSSTTTRWQWIGDGDLTSTNGMQFADSVDGLRILQDDQIPSIVVQTYDAKREPSPRPHFLKDWLKHPAGTVLALVDPNGFCHGFGRIRPCLLSDGEGWRIGPLLADTPNLAEKLLRLLIMRHKGVILIDTPGLNSKANPLLQKLGFQVLSETLRMYKGEQPPISMNDVYGLACLELG